MANSSNTRTPVWKSLLMQTPACACQQFPRNLTGPHLSSTFQLYKGDGDGGGKMEPQTRAPPSPLPPFPDGPWAQIHRRASSGVRFASCSTPSILSLPHNTGNTLGYQGFLFFWSTILVSARSLLPSLLFPQDSYADGAFLRGRLGKDPGTSA